jgi:hypothetical protein
MMNLKIATFEDDREIPFVYGKKWMIKKYPSINAVQVGVDKGQIDLLIQFARRLKPPFYVLYVLLVSRCGNEPGRYESDPFYGIDELEIFLKKYSAYLENDGRHNIWVGEIEDQGLLVYDQHNRLFGYGDLTPFLEILAENGYQEGEVKIASPHSHHYNKEFDEDEKGILKEKEWKHLPLQEDDE